jgi:hypothetical protein
MAERRRQVQYRCQLNYLPDRHVLQKLSQVYRLLVPPEERDDFKTSLAPLTLAQDEQARRHLRQSFF